MPSKYMQILLKGSVGGKRRSQGLPLFLSFSLSQIFSFSISFFLPLLKSPNLFFLSPFLLRPGFPCSPMFANVHQPLLVVLALLPGGGLGLGLGAFGAIAGLASLSAVRPSTRLRPPKYAVPSVVDVVNATQHHKYISHV